MRTNQKGFTLVELMVALVLAIIVSSVMYSLYKVQNQAGVTQGQVSEMQQNMRSGLDILTRELRMSGYDPQRTGNYGITKAESAVLEYNLDACENGNAPANGVNCTELHVLELYTANGIQKLRRTAGGSAIAEYVDNIEFCYFLGNFDAVTEEPVYVATTTDYDNIQAVKISILVRSARESSDYQNTSRYVSAGGVSWNPQVDGNVVDFDDGFRRRLMITTVNLRNTGL